MHVREYLDTRSVNSGKRNTKEMFLELKSENVGIKRVVIVLVQVYVAISVTV